MTSVERIVGISKCPHLSSCGLLKQRGKLMSENGKDGLTCSLWYSLPKKAPQRYTLMDVYTLSFKKIFRKTWLSAIIIRLQMVFKIPLHMERSNVILLHIIGEADRGSKIEDWGGLMALNKTLPLNPLLATNQNKLSKYSTLLCIQSIYNVSDCKYTHTV